MPPPARNAAYRQRCSEVKAGYNADVADRVKMLCAARKLDVDAELVSHGLNAMIDGLWVSKQVSGSHSTAANDAAKRVCLNYLRAYFPSDFPGLAHARARFAGPEGQGDRTGRSWSSQPMQA